MPPELAKAHARLDKVVDAAFEFAGRTAHERHALLLNRYATLVGK